jgi:hypothetical protein
MSHQPDNIFAGTQVVSLIEVRGTNNSLVHPRGAVGVVTRGGRNYTATSNAPSPKPNCRSGPTMKRQILSSSKPEGKWQPSINFESVMATGRIFIKRLNL